MGQWDGGIVWVGVWMCDFGWMRGEGGKGGVEENVRTPIPRGGWRS